MSVCLAGAGLVHCNHLICQAHSAQWLISRRELNCLSSSRYEAHCAKLPEPNSPMLSNGAAFRLQTPRATRRHANDSSRL